MKSSLRAVTPAGFVIHAGFILLSILFVIPFLLVIAISITEEQTLTLNGYHLIPQQLDFTAYEVILRAPQQLLRAYGVTIFVTVVGTIGGLLLTSMSAYVLSRQDFRYRRPITFYIFFTMLFNGGLVPLYILVSQYLHLKNTIWVLILPYLLNPFYILLMKGFLEKIPAEIIESAKIDGAREIRTFATIILPLSKPALATIGLFISFTYWNDWYLGLLFIDNPNLVSLQLLLYRVMNSIEFLNNNAARLGMLRINLSKYPTLSARMAIAILAAGPMLVVFPFFQKYFVRGLTVGSLKG
ncbi:carbohydrate ABC transporter permease [Paenibacillus cymbidii]|uniref:carbohydrate ABC transporter permease n=1 Tax=Paenibacillus cymbidii TaxID=1639034 RepID=UPI0010813BE8|nr:carbohydrate ABC transporter permease [Paenibacillus cymbidii]